MSASIVTESAFVRALATASHVELSAYVLDRRSAVARALEACGDRHAEVTVVLEGAPFAGRSASAEAADRNRRLAADLAEHGVVVKITGPRDAPVHMKAAIVDGTAYLNDRNWPNGGADTIVATTDAADLGVVEAALAGKAERDGHLATEKAAALALEAQAIAAGSGDRVDLESESFGYSAVSKALYDRARAGAHVRLLVAGRDFAEAGHAERASLARLAAAGVSVRVGNTSEKCCVAGNAGWVGSANATYDFGTNLDWGLATGDGAMLVELEGNFERSWAAASAL